MSNTDNPGIGHNLGTDAPDYAKQETDRLALDYAELATAATDLIGEADKVPDDKDWTADDKSTAVNLIKRLRDLRTRIEGLHDIEKQPFLRRGQGVDNFFFGIWDRVAKRNKNNNPGAGDILLAKLTRYDNRKEAEERERREAAAREAARIAADAERERIRLENEERDRLAAAERARKPEKIADHVQAADLAATQASQARVEETVAAANAEEARISTLQSSADMMRTRTDTGTMSTRATEPFAEITDRKTLDIVALGPYIAQDALQKALNAYAKANGHSSDESVQIKGARFGRRAKSTVR